LQIAREPAFEAMNLWLTDQAEVPAASTIEALVATREEDLAEGGISVAIPFDPEVDGGARL
jgi:hypothetical protein